MVLPVQHILISPVHDPSMNLALEELLFRHKDETILLLYRNSKSVIVGKHQNPFAEVNLSFVKKQGIPIYRRITGGGTVYHDLDNLNYSFLYSHPEGDKPVNFFMFLHPMIAFLSHEGIAASIGARNELLLGDRKISGTACHVFKQRSIHHGSLLVHTDLELLHDVIGKEKHRFVSKAVSSVSSKVMNLCEERPELSADTLAAACQQFFLDRCSDAHVLHLKESEWKEVSRLAQEKYICDDWNYNYSPSFRYLLNATEELVVEKGVVTAVYHNNKIVEEHEYVGQAFARFVGR